MGTNCLQCEEVVYNVRLFVSCHGQVWCASYNAEHSFVLLFAPNHKSSCDGKIAAGFSYSIVRASQAFGCLRKALKSLGCLWVPVFFNLILSTDTKRVFYKAVMVSFLLKALNVRKLTSFHNFFVRTILDMSRFQQWQSTFVDNLPPVLVDCGCG